MKSCRQNPADQAYRVSKGYLPQPPAGFHTKITYTDPMPISPTDIYLMVIGYLFGYVQTD